MQYEISQREVLEQNFAMFKEAVQKHSVTMRNAPDLSFQPPSSYAIMVPTRLNFFQELLSLQKDHKMSSLLDLMIPRAVKLPKKA